MTRPKIQNPDGSFSTERSITIESNGKFLNIPTIIGGRQRTNKEAIDHALKTGENMGIFSSQQEAVQAAQRRSQEIGRLRR